MGSGKSKKVRVPVYPAITGPMVAQMVSRANQAAQNVNVPTLAELFPYMNQNPFFGMQQGTIPTQNMSGAGRFLGQGMTGMQQAPTNMPQASVYQAPMAQQFSYMPQQNTMPSGIQNAMNAGMPYDTALMFQNLLSPIANNPTIQPTSGLTYSTGPSRNT